MTDTERRYSQIEKEAFALVWACEKFHDYVLGKHIDLKTDHKPLVLLMSTTSLDSLPPQVPWFRLRLMRFYYSICHIAGQYLYTADTLLHARFPSRGSRCPGRHTSLLSAIELPRKETLSASNCSLYAVRDGPLFSNRCHSTFNDFGPCEER